MHWMDQKNSNQALTYQIQTFCSQKPSIIIDVMKSKQPKTKNIYKRDVFKSGIQCEECMIWRDDLFTVGTLLQC